MAGTDKPVQEPLKEMSIKDIKAKIAETKNGELVKLRSGLVFRLGRPSIGKLLKDNIFPSELIAIAIKMDVNPGAYEPQSREEYLQAVDVIEKVAVEAALSPKIVKNEDEVTDESIYVGDLDDLDLTGIYLYAQTGAKPLHSFREGGQDGDGGSGVQEVPGNQAQ